MTMNTHSIPSWFKVVTILTILWNGLGALSYILQSFTTEAMLQSTYNDAQVEAFLTKPAWATAAYALAVWFGLVGSILLRLRKGLSIIFLLVSFAGVLGHSFYMFFYLDAIELFGPSVIYMPIFVLIVSIYLLVLFFQAKNKGWLD